MRLKPLWLTLATCGVALLSVSVSSFGEGTQQSVDTEQREDAEDCCESARFFNIKIDGDKFTLVEVDPFDDAQQKVAAATVRVQRAANEVSVKVSCRTSPTNSSGRKSCSDSETHTLPGRYVFVKEKAEKHWHTDIGSENTVKITWSDYIEIIPGSGIELPQTMTVKGHARSGGGQGERGKTSCTVTCPFVEIEG